MAVVRINNAKYSGQVKLPGKSIRFTGLRVHYSDPTTAAADIRSLGEETANAATHGLGLVLSIGGTAAIFASSQQLLTSQAITCGIYTTTLIAVYAISTLSHVVQQPDRKQTLRALDQGVIYLLIAGTYTPLMWAYVPGNVHWLGLTFVWAAAFTGKYFKVVARRRVHDFSSWTYLFLGWVPAMIFFWYVPWQCLFWIALGGVMYTLGTFFLMNDRIRPYFHAIWHLFVILGSACHFYAIYAFVLKR